MNDLTLPNKQFYDSVSDYYDEMISADKAIDRKTKVFKDFLPKNNLTVADLGSGSGVDSIALTNCGHRVDSFEPSPGMLAESKRNFKKYKVKILSNNCTIDKIPERFNSRYDYAVSLGNTFANVPFDKIEVSLTRIFDILKSGTKCIIQILNYELILAQQERIINIKQLEKWHYIRFYDFFGDQVRFNILKYENDNPQTREIISTTIYPYTAEKLTKIAEKVGFRNIKKYADFKKKKFQKSKSKNLILELYR